MPLPAPRGAPPLNRPGLHVLPITTLAVVLRFLAVWSAVSHHAPSWFYGQASELGQLSASLAGGHGLSSPFGGATGPSAFLPPGYPMLVASIFAVFRPFSLASAVALMILQALFGAGTVVLVMHLGSRMFGAATSNLAGLLCAISPPLIFFTTMFWDTALTTLLFVSLLALALACADRSSTTRWIGAGAFCALALTFNPSLLPVICCCAGWAGWKARRHSTKSLVLAAGTCVLLCAPWVVRNQRALHAFIPLRSNLGYELWQGNGPGADGFFNAELHPNVNPREFAEYKFLGEMGYMRQKSTIAKAAIRSGPRRFFALTAKRFVCFWTGVGRTPARPLVLYVSGISLGGFAGLLLLSRRSHEFRTLLLLPLVLFPAPYYVTHPDPRFRLVLDPLLLLLTAYAVTACLSHVQPSEPGDVIHGVFG